MAKKIYWKMIKKDTWNKEWEHEPTKIRINVSSNVTNAAGWRTVDWILELNTHSNRYIIRENSRELGDLKGSYITKEDREIKNEFIGIARKMMRDSNGFTTIKQFSELIKKYKK